MKVRMLQTLTVNGATFPAGEIAELPTTIAVACLRRGTAQRADLPYENRVTLPPENRVELPLADRSENGPAEGFAATTEDASSVEAEGEPELVAEPEPGEDPEPPEDEEAA